MHHTASRRTLAALTASLVAAALLPLPATAVPRPSAPRVSAKGGVAVRFRDRTVTQARLRLLADESSGTVRAVGHGLVRVTPPAGASAASVAARLRTVPGVKYASPIGRVTALFAVPPSDTYYLGASGQGRYLGPTTTPSSRYGIDLEPAWRQAFGTTGDVLDPYRQGVTLAVIDSGYESSSVENSSALIVPRLNYVPADPPTTDVRDDYGHGTAVTMVMRATADNAFGIAGVLGATRSKVLVYKVLDETGTGDSLDVAAAIYQAADDGARVINLSLGQKPAEDHTALDDAVQYARAKDSLVVAAAGNDGTTGIRYPAASPGAIAVGATNPSTGLLSWFSDVGPELSLVAPGEDIDIFNADHPNKTLDPSTGQPYWSGAPKTTSLGSGTSFASPMVAASLALLWSCIPSATPETVTSIATSTATDDPFTPGFDTSYGWGRLDVWRAYQALESAFSKLPDLTLHATPAPDGTSTLTWTSLGAGVTYHYGREGGPVLRTTDTSGVVSFSLSGTSTAFVQASAGDRWPSAVATASVAVSGRPDPVLWERYPSVPGDRYDTAASVSLGAFPSPSSVTTVVVASGESWPDALDGAVLAAADGGPLLLTRRDTLPQVTRAELTRLHPRAIVVVGGPAAVGAGVFSSLQGVLSDPSAVTRISGGDRYETAAAVASELRRVSGGGTVGTAMVASGERFPDAVSGATMAAAAGWPILLSRQAALPPATADALSSLGVTHTVVLGSELAVGATAAAGLPGPERWQGADRYATSRAIAEHAVAAGILGWNDLGIATGRNYPDASAAGPFMARRHGPLLLADADTPDLDAWLTGVGPSVARIDIFGSTLVVSDALRDRIIADLRAP